jgi:hypothetical protein
MAPFSQHDLERDRGKFGVQRLQPFWNPDFRHSGDVAKHGLMPFGPARSNGESGFFHQNSETAVGKVVSRIPALFDVRK